MDYGSYNRVKPYSKVFGADRGLPIDRYYIELFLQSNSKVIKGTVLEVGNPTYSNKFSGDKITKLEILHKDSTNEQATITGDLESTLTLPKDCFDCIIFTQTLQCIFDHESVIQNLYDSLKSNGVLLATFPGISQISNYDMIRWGDYWRFTYASAKMMFGKVFEEENIKIHTYGNVFTASSFLYGVSASEIKQEFLNYHDQNYQLLIALKAKK